MDFEDIKGNAKRFATTIRGPVTGGNLQPYVALSEDVDFRIIFDVAKHRAETIRPRRPGDRPAGTQLPGGVRRRAAGPGGAVLAFGASAIEGGCSAPERWARPSSSATSPPSP